MSDGFVVLWPAKRLAWLDRIGEIGMLPEVIYGSPHGSAPSLKRYGIQPGDRIFIVSLLRGDLYVVTRFVLDRVITTDAYFKDHLGLGDADLALHLWKLSEKLGAERPELGHRLPFGCVDEAALPREASPMRLDLLVPRAVLEELRFRPKRGEAYGLPLRDGKITKTNSVQGHFYRLIPESTAALDALVAKAKPVAAKAKAPKTRAAANVKAPRATPES
jgi:hypothetical protein